MNSEMWDEHQYSFQAIMSAVPPDVGHCRCLFHGHGMPRVPHYLYTEYVGSATAQEVVGKLYNSKWFSEITLYAIPRHLSKLMHTDAFGAGFDPVSCIKSLSVVCMVDEYRTLPMWYPPSENHQFTPDERMYIEQEQLKSHFDHLLAVVDNKGFRYLNVTFMQRNIRIGVLEEALETLTSVHKAFRKAGITVRILWEYTHDHLVCCRNLEDFFRDPRPSWKARMFQFLQKVSSSLCL